MRHKKVKVFALLLLFGFGLTGLQAQETIPASGGNASGSAGAVSYTVGQIVYTTNTGTTGSVAQGVQQPYEISVITGLDEAKNITLQCSVYPNPTTDFLNLHIENYKVEALTFHLYDMNGRLLKTRKVISNETSISMASLAPATYLLVITDNKKSLKTFKIIKR